MPDRIFGFMNGKTIKTAEQKQLKNFDDAGFLRLNFTDGTHTTIVGGYGGYTGQSSDEYKTLIAIMPRSMEKLLQSINK